MPRVVVSVALAFMLLICIMPNESQALSCYAGRAACIASCMAQNCATGYCLPATAKPADQICTCSRCEKGPAPAPRK